MAFRNSILAGEELIRSGMRSENYVAGVSGWRVGRDGTAEFLQVLVRGSLVTGVAPNARIEIIPDADGFGTPGILLYPPGVGALPATIFFDDPNGLVLSSPNSDASIVIGAGQLDLLTAGGITTLQGGDVDADNLAIGGTDRVSGIKMVTITAVTSALGFIIWNHNAGTVPLVIQVEAEVPIQGGGGLFASQHMTDSYAANTARTRFWDQFGAPLNAVNVTFRALVLF